MHRGAEDADVAGVDGMHRCGRGWWGRGGDVQGSRGCGRGWRGRGGDMQGIRASVKSKDASSFKVTPSMDFTKI